MINIKVLPVIFGIIVLLGFSQCSNLSTEVYVIETEVGDITFEVYPDKAPITVANLKKYVNQAKFDDAYFYRVVRLDNQPINPIKIEVIQGDFTGKQNYFSVLAIAYFFKRLKICSLKRFNLYFW